MKTAGIAIKARVMVIEEKVTAKVVTLKIAVRAIKARVEVIMVKVVKVKIEVIMVIIVKIEV